MSLDPPHGSAVTADGCVDDNDASAYLEGTLSPPQHQRVERHAAGCDACRELLSTLARARAEETDHALDAGDDRTELAFLKAPAPVMEATLPAGTQVGRYVVSERLAEGGMGVVYQARDTKLERTVALKFLLGETNTSGSSAEGEQRLLREAQAIAKLAHPNVVVVYDFGTFNDKVFLAMEYVPGGTLRGWLGDAARPWRQTLDCYLQAGEGLAHAHAAGLVHRDFKPDNVLMGADGRPRVTDFGLARSASEDSKDTTSGPGGKVSNQMLDVRLTRTGAVMGTPAYMAPEQHRGEATSAAADQFAFCVGLYEGLYGQRPFSKAAMASFAVSGQSASPEPPPPDAQVPAEIFRVLARGLRVAPEERHPSMNALLHALRRAALGNSGRTRWAIGGAVAAALAVGALTWSWMSGGTTDPMPGVAAPAGGAPAAASPTPEPAAELPREPSPATPAVAPVEPTVKPTKKLKSKRLQKNGTINPF